MANLQIRCFGFTEADHQQLQLLLSQYNSSFHRQWQINRTGQAGLCFYNIDSPLGLRGWQQRDTKLLNIYCSRRKSPADKNLLSIKLPLTENHLFSLLAFAERHLGESRRLSGGAFRFIQFPANVTSPGLFSLWLRKVMTKSRSRQAGDLPSLFLLQSETCGERRGDIITDPSLLQTWLSQLTEDLPQRLSILLANLQSVKQHDISENRMMQLLEVYFAELQRLLLKRDSKSISAEAAVKSASQRNLTNFNLTIRCLAELYFSLADKHYQRGERPKGNPRYLFCLNRGAALLSMQILHAYTHYRVAPKDCWQQLHQLLFYLEKANALEVSQEIPSLGKSESFEYIYKRIALVAIADPYSLSRFSVIRLFSLLAEVTNKVKISTIPPQQQVLENAFLLTGFFCIEIHEDHSPKAMSKTPQLIRADADNRLLQTQDVLTILGQKLLMNSRSESTLDLQLIRQVLPQLAANYQRQSSRNTLVNSADILLVHGFDSILQYLSGTTIDVIQASIQNQSNEGIMLELEASSSMVVNELVLIVTQNGPQLATLNWFSIDWDNNALAGLNLLEGIPEVVDCLSENDTKHYPALQLATYHPALITQKGVFSPKRQLVIVNGKQIATRIECKTLFSATLDHERFTYIVHPGS